MNQYIDKKWEPCFTAIDGEVVAFHIVDGIRGSTDAICSKELRGDFTVQELIQNANLISASPELLEACKSALDLILEFHDEQGTTSPLRHTGNTDFREEIMILKQALSKATGGTE